jgi:hypothetical protein
MEVNLQGEWSAYKTVLKKTEVPIGWQGYVKGFTDSDGESTIRHC